MSALPLQPPAARQGPGPIPSRLLDALDALLVRLVERRLTGDRLAVGVGSGIELAQLRPYEPGDDVRHIDAAASARTAQPHVRLHVPERALTTWIILDLSPSMAFGTAARLKADIAEGVASILARLAVRRAGSVGVVAFGAGKPIVLAPRGARRGVAAVRELLAAGVAPDGRHDRSALAEAAAQALKLATRRGLVVLVSDFREQDGWEPPLAALSRRHAVIAIEVSDPREGALPAAGRLALVDPETGGLIEVNTSSARLRSGFEQLERERRQALAAELSRLRVAHVALATDADWTAELARGLRTLTAPQGRR
jgi:uncharacterized protein (DUF58 family)